MSLEHKEWSSFLTENYLRSKVPSGFSLDFQAAG